MQDVMKNKKCKAYSRARTKREHVRERKTRASNRGSERAVEALESETSTMRRKVVKTANDQRSNTRDPFGGEKWMKERGEAVERRRRTEVIEEEKKGKDGRKSRSYEDTVDI